MRVISVLDLVAGMTIIEGKRTIPVKVCRDGWSCKGIHVNQQVCYNRAALIEVKD